MKRNILKEAIEDAKALKEAAYSNAKNVLLENMKDSIKEAVDEQLSEACGDEDEMEGDEKVMENLDGLADEFGDEETEDSDADVCEDDDLTEDDLSEAIAEALDALHEVEDASHGEPSMVDHGHPTKSPPETDWEDEDAPAKKDFTVKESKTLRKKVTELVKENVLLKKANKKLRETVDEIKLFNTKILFTNKLINKEGLTSSVKKKIVEKMDSVKSLSEARSVFEAFEVTLGSLSESAKPARKAPALSEVLGSGAHKAVNRESLQESLRGGSFSNDRMQRLAGIKKED